MLEMIMFISLGIVAGVICGLIPGIHPNLFAAFVLSFIFMFPNPISASIFLVSAAVANSFICYIPSVLLGAPEEDTAMGVLPGHRLLMKGRGYEAIKLTALGGLGAAFFSVLTLPIFAIAIPFLYSFMRPMLGYILLAVIAYLLAGEKNKFLAVTVFFLSGFLGLIILNSFIVDEPLMPMLSGLFGLPILLFSYFKDSKLPEKIEFACDKIKNKDIIASIGAGSISGILAGLLPGLGSSQATVLAQQFTEKGKDEDMSARKFLIASGGVNTADIIYSLFAIVIISNPRSGIAVAVSKILEIGFSELALLIATVIASSIIGYYLTIRLTKTLISIIKKLDYKKLSLYTFILINLIVFLLSGPLGILISTVSLFIGLIPNIKGIRRTWCMGCLLMPTILWFL